MNKELLPIGSIVKLEKVTIEVMIAGYGIRDVNDTSKIYDYIGLIWPDGLINSNQNLLFNTKDILETFHIGYKDAEQIEFANKISKIMNKIKQQ